MVNLILLVILTGERPFFCPSNGCEKTFSTQYSLKSHMKGHDNKGHLYNALPNHNGSEVCAVFCLWFWSGCYRTAAVVSISKLKGQRVFAMYLSVRDQGQDLCFCEGVVEARDITRLPVLRPLIQLHFLLSGMWKSVLKPEVSEWFPKGQPGALNGYYFPIHAYKMTYLYLSLQHELVLCFTHLLISHWRTRQSRGGPLPFWIVCRPDLRATGLRHWATEQASAKF